MIDPTRDVCGENNIKNDLIYFGTVHQGKIVDFEEISTAALGTSKLPNSFHFVFISSLLLLLLLFFTASYGPFILYIFPLFNILNAASHDIFAQ